MKNFPEWVPNEVVAYYRKRCEPKEYADEYEERGTDALYQVMKSPRMEKAWKAITRRSDEVHPVSFATEILYAAQAATQIPWYPSRKETLQLRKLATKVRALHPEFESILGYWNNEVLMHWFGSDPVKAIDQLATSFERFANMVEDHRSTLTLYSAKPDSKNAKRTFVIRLLSARLTELYGTPLHDVVAAVTGVLLDEDVDAELVRQLVRYWHAPQ